MKKAIITIGASGSGKSRWANEFIKTDDNHKYWVNICRDDFRKEILEEKHGIHYNKETRNMWSLWKFTKDNEREVSNRVADKLNKAIEANKNIIISDTNLNEPRVNALLSEFEKNGYVCELKFVHLPYEVLVKNDANRLDSVGALTIGRQLSNLYSMSIWKAYVAKFPIEAKFSKVGKPYDVNYHIKNCILVDIDGTIAHMVNRTAFEWDLVDTDKFDEIVWSAVQGIADKNDADIIIVSGRSDICRLKTQSWLDFNCGRDSFKSLYMRVEGDFTCDTKVKESMVNDIRKDYNIIAVFDDRPKVARMYRSLGLKVFQLGDPHNEF